MPLSPLTKQTGLRAERASLLRLRPLPDPKLHARAFRTKDTAPRRLSYDATGESLAGHLPLHLSESAVTGTKLRLCCCQLHSREGRDATADIRNGRGGARHRRARSG